MPTWSELVKEIAVAQQQGVPNAIDVVRRKYIAALSTHTGRNTILYATRWTIPGPQLGDLVSITEEDTQGFMEVVHGLKGKSLDIVLHSPGGSGEATEAIVSYLRKKFDDIRVIVPHAAMSAATMLACSANRIVMGKQSSLGPIDPQFLMVGDGGVSAMIPAQAILDQFDLAKEECQDPKMLSAWIPMLGQYGPALLVQCRDALDLSRELVEEWLTQFMFSGKASAKKDARKVASALSDHKFYKSHARHIDRDKARNLGGVGLVVDDLESDQTLQDLALSIYHACSHTFSSTQAAKLMENQNGRAFIKIAVQVPIIQQVRRPAPGAPPPANPPSTPPGPPQGNPPP